MKILLFGHAGQVGSALISVLPTTHHLIIPNIDITNDDLLNSCILSARPDIIMNAAAYTNVDGAEEHIQKAFQINSLAPKLMAKAAKEIDSLLIHYSTDYVFDGRGDTPWVETDIPAPLNEYGHSKHESEQNIIQSGCRYLIFRTSWVYGTHGDNFIKKIIRLSKEKKQIHVVSDQIGAPTSAQFIAQATYHALENKKAAGLYHLCCAGEVSWYEFACFVRDTYDPQSDFDIQPILSKDYPQKALRPLNSRLNCKKFITDFNLLPPDWKTECGENFANILKDME